MSKILIVDDEIKICETIKAYLEIDGYECDIALGGEEALQYFNSNKYDLIILDRMLPDISGEEVCKIIRKKSLVHIIMLTAKIDDEDKIEGFNYGCDDYICKPFNIRELVLRVKAVTRKLNKQIDRIIKFDNGIEINEDLKSVKVRSKPIDLTNTEYKIFLKLAKNPNKIFTREDLLSYCFNENLDKIDRVIDSHIKNLRQKIEIDTKQPKIIKTVYGIGYKFAIEV